MTKTIALIAVLGAAMLTACGEDKNYGDPLTDPNAPAYASAAVTNARTLTADTTNDTALFALNGLSGNMNILGGAKLQQEQQTNQSLGQGSQVVDDACVDISESGIVYDDCDWQGTTVNGSVSRSGADVSIDLTFVTVTTDTTQTTDARAELTITATELSGFVDFDLDYQLENGSLSAGFDGDFDVVLAEGCAVGGELEIHATASSYGQSQSVWVKAEFGPACGDIVVR